MSDATRSSQPSATVGQLLRHHRLERRLTQTELARQIGIQQSDLSRMEKGEYRVSLDVLFRILRVFEMSLGEFFGDLASRHGRGCGAVESLQKTLDRSAAFDQAGNLRQPVARLRTGCLHGVVSENAARLGGRFWGSLLVVLLRCGWRAKDHHKQKDVERRMPDRGHCTTSLGITIVPSIIPCLVLRHIFSRGLAAATPRMTALGVGLFSMRLAYNGHK